MDFLTQRHKSLQPYGFFVHELSDNCLDHMGILGLPNAFIGQLSSFMLYYL
jgi:hypothetical protein